MLGVILSDTNFGVSEKTIDMRRAILALDGEVTMGYHVYPRIGIEELVDALLDRAVRLHASPLTRGRNRHCTRAPDQQERAEVGVAAHVASCIGTPLAEIEANQLT